MKVLNKILLLVLLTLTISCGTYTTSSYRPKIKSLLAITEAGDTVSVPMREFEKQKYDTYTRFNYNDNWYWNSWRYNDPIFWSRYNWNNPGNWNRFRDYNNRYITPNRPYVRPKVKPKTRPRNPPPRTRPRYKPTRPIIPLQEPRERIRINTPRGSNQNYTPRTTPTPRTRTTPNTQTRTNVGRGSGGGRRNNQ